MLQTLKKIFFRWRLRRDLSHLLWEIQNNLETFYVAKQQDQLRPLRLTIWEKMRQRPEALWQGNLLEYVLRVTEYNKAYKAAQDYESWYSQNLDHQDHTSAKTLDALQERAQKLFVDLETLIKSAQEEIENSLKVLRLSGDRGQETNVFNFNPPWRSR